jgi:CheY-like chemotaxis protein
VDSTPGRGSHFSVFLPLPSVIRSGAATVPERNGQNLALPLDLRVLVAEDNEINQLVLTTILGQLGVTAHMVADGAAAVEAWQGGDWDLILMDVQMPVMDGPTAARAIRARETSTRRQYTPIVAVTANAMSHQRQDYRMAGMDDLVSKPIRVSELAMAIQRAIGPRG